MSKGHRAEKHARGYLAKEYGVPLKKQKVSLYDTEEQKEFDAVSEDCSIIAEITATGCKDLRQKHHPLSRLCIRVIELSLARRAHPGSQVLLVLTDPVTYQVWIDSPHAVEAKLLGIQTQFIPFPNEKEG